MRWRLFIVTLLFVGLGASAFFLVHAMNEAPAWYAPLPVVDAVVEERAERVEYGVVELTHRIRSANDPWGIALTDEEANAWLAARLPAWLELETGRAWPEKCGVPFVHMDESGIDLAIPLRGRLGERVAHVRLVPTVEEGMLLCRLERAGIGQVGMGAGPLDGLRAIADEVTPGVGDDEGLAALLGFLSGEEAVPARLELSDGREVELESLRLRDGGIELLSRTRAGSQ